MNSSSRTKHRGGLSPDKYLSEPQINRLLKHLRRRSAGGCPRHALNEFIMIVLLYSGTRAEELLSLRLRNLPGYHGKNTIEIEHGKGNVSRAIIIPDWLSNYITGFVRRYRKHAKPASFLIQNERRRRMTYRCLYSKVRRIGKAAGIGHLHPHMCRHTYLSMLYRVKKDLLFIQRQAGHKSPVTTAIYSHIENPEQQEQVQSLPIPTLERA